MQRVRAIDAFLVWTISIVLAATFVTVGVPKVFGWETVGLQAAAMRGFPPFIRVIVGICETVGGIALLLPPIATTAALVLAAAMVPATITQLMSGEPGVFVPLTVLALLMFIAWRRNAPALSESYRGFRAMPHPLLYEGVVAGFLGATTIAFWFLIIDAIAGRPFFTPTTLGHGLLSILGFGADKYPATIDVLVYTAFHYAAFMFVGLTAALVVFLARSQPSVLFAFVLLFAVTEVGVYMLVGLLDVASPLGQHAWLPIMAGNVIAALTMGTYFWRHHRELADEFRHSLDWEMSEVIAPPEVVPMGSGGQGPGGPTLGMTPIHASESAAPIANGPTNSGIQI